MFGSLILRSLSTGPALAEVVVMGGGLMGTGIAQVCIPQYLAVWSAKILKVTHLVCLDRCPDPAQGDPGGPERGCAGQVRAADPGQHQAGRQEAAQGGHPGRGPVRSREPRQAPVRDGRR